MELCVQAFGLPKKGNSPEEYEDAVACSTSEWRFAVSDGATESSFADRWAQELTDAFIAEPPSLSDISGRDLEEWLKPLQQAWRASIDWDHLPWFAEEKARAGAFAALVGLMIGHTPSVANSNPPQLTDPSSTRLNWQSLAVGDSCLFQVQSDRLVLAFPLDRSEQFDNRPLLLSSNPNNNRGIWEALRLYAGTCGDEDTFFLATDALAQWFLAQHEMELKPWNRFMQLKTDDDFELFIGDLRETRSIRNDDVTLIAIHINCDGSFVTDQKSD